MSTRHGGALYAALSTSVQMASSAADGSADAVYVLCLAEQPTAPLSDGTRGRLDHEVGDGLAGRGVEEDVRHETHYEAEADGHEQLAPLQAAHEWRHVPSCERERVGPRHRFRLRLLQRGRVQYAQLQPVDAQFLIRCDLRVATQLVYHRVPRALPLDDLIRRIRRVSQRQMEQAREQ